MLVNRRAVLAAFAYAGVMPRVIGQGPTSPLSLRVENAAGVVASPAGDAVLPTLAVRLPGHARPSLVIEFPEHAWRKVRPDDEPQWFYRLYRNEPRLGL